MNTDDYKSVYSRLQDDISKDIFAARCLLNLTEDMRFFKMIYLTIPTIRALYEKLRNTDKPAVIFGAGTWGKCIKEAFSDISFKCYVDNDTHKNYCADLKVKFANDYFAGYSNDLIVISSRVYWKEIYQQVKNLGVEDRNIINIQHFTTFMRHDLHSSP